MVDYDEEFVRDSDAIPEVGYYDQRIKDILDSADISTLLDDNGELRQGQYHNIDGEFYYINVDENRRGMIRKKGKHFLLMNNPLTEWVVGNILIGDDTKINFGDDYLNGMFGSLITYVEENFYLLPKFGELYLKKVKFLNTKRKYKRGRRKQGENKKVISITNPKTKREIKVDKKAYKEIYGSIKLRKVEYKSLSKYDQIEYEINENCMIDFFILYEKIQLKEIEEMLQRNINIIKDEIISISETIEIYEKLDIGIKIYDCCHNVFHNSGNDRIFKIYGDHIHLLSTDEENKKPRKRLIKNIEDIDKYKNNVLITSDDKLFNDIMIRIKNNFNMIEYNERYIPYKTNEIIYDPFYNVDQEILKNNSSQCRSLYNFINEKLRLMGTMNNETYDIFRKCNKIIFMTSEKINKILLDMNKTYPYQFTKEGIIFGVPSINDYWEKYDEKKYVVHGWYYCILNDYDDLLGINNNIYSYYEVEILKRDMRIKKITKMFIPSYIVKMTKDEIDFIKTLNVDRVRCFIGWLIKSRSIYVKNYDNVSDKKSIKALKKFYGNEVIVRRKQKENTTIRVSKSYCKKKTGILANLLIKGLSNIDLYEFDKKMKQLNDGIILNTVRTDSLGYYYEKEIKLPEELMGTEWGQFKDETYKEKERKRPPTKHYYKTVKNCPEPTIKNEKIKDYTLNDINKLLESLVSFIICGDYGTGKTYTIDHNIIPKLKEMNKEYIVSSITKTNSERINGVTLASLLNGKSEFELKDMFKKIDYLIIDEAQMITQEYLKTFDILKRYNINTKYIFIGDTKQIKNNGIDEDWDKSKFSMSLCEYNKLTMVENHRCEQKLINLIKEIEKMPLYLRHKFIYDNFQTSNNINICNYHLCRFKKTKEKNETNNLKFEQIIKTQGQTIEEKYMIHDIKNLKREQVITALSRARKWENIYIYC